MSNPTPAISPLAAICAWLWPGLGHIMIGERKRGFGVMAGVLFLVISGLLIGGFNCVDRKEHRLWFVAQAGCGPIVLAADFINQSHVKKIPPPRRYDTVGLARVAEMGTLFIALAGLMNVVVILDALHFVPRTDHRRDPADPADREATA